MVDFLGNNAAFKKYEIELKKWREENPMKSKQIGGFIYFIIIFLWLFGLVSPFTFLPYWLFNSYYKSVLVWLAVAVFPYIAPNTNEHTNGYYYTKFCLWIRLFLPKWFNSYKVSIEKNETESLNPKLYCVAPHGIFCAGWSLVACLYEMIGTRYLVTGALYHAPFFKALIFFLNKYGSVSKDDLVSFMKKKENLAFIPGGFQEATLFKFQADRIYVKKRKGFVKLALKYGYQLIPIFCFGESETYRNIQAGLSWRLFLNKYNIPAVAPWGWNWFPLLPRPQANMHLVFAKPIVLPKIENPTVEDVEKYHRLYMESIVAAYEKYKPQDSETELEIF